jgi:hypothetical protein
MSRTSPDRGVAIEIMVREIAVAMWIGIECLYTGISIVVIQTVGAPRAEVLIVEIPEMRSSSTDLRIDRKTMIPNRPGCKLTQIFQLDHEYLHCLPGHLLPPLVLLRHLCVQVPEALVSATRGDCPKYTMYQPANKFIQ